MKLKFATMALCSAMALPVAADEVELVHDKGFWSDALQQVATATTDATGTPFVEAAYSNPEQYKAFIQSSVAGGDMPDLFSWWTGGVYRDIVESGAVAELDDIWNDLVASGDYSPATRDFFKVGDHIYGLPLHLSRWIVLYNKEQFKSAGLKEPQTWEELVSAAKTLKASGVTPFHATTQDGWRGFIWFEELMIRTDPDAYRALHRGELGYDSEPVRKVFQIWSDWYANGYFTDPRSNEEFEDFARGKGAMYLIGDWAIGNVEKVGMTAGTDFGAFILPNMDPGLDPAVIVESGPILVSKKGISKPEVVAAVKYLLSVDGSNSWAKASGISNGNQKADAPNPILAKIAADINEHEHVAIERWWEAVPADIQGEAVAEFSRFMLDPTMETAEKVMANIQEFNAEYWENQ